MRFENLNGTVDAVFGKADGKYFVYDGYSLMFTSIDFFQKCVDEEFDVNITPYITDSFDWSVDDHMVELLKFVKELRPAFEEQTGITSFSPSFWGIDRESLEGELFDFSYGMEHIGRVNEMIDEIHSLSDDELLEQVIRALEEA